MTHGNHDLIPVQEAQTLFAAEHVTPSAFMLDLCLTNGGQADYSAVTTMVDVLKPQQNQE